MPCSKVAAPSYVRTLHARKGGPTRTDAHTEDITPLLQWFEGGEGVGLILEIVSLLFMTSWSMMVSQSLLVYSKTVSKRMLGGIFSK